MFQYGEAQLIWLAHFLGTIESLDCHLYPHRVHLFQYAPHPLHFFLIFVTLHFNY